MSTALVRCTNEKCVKPVEFGMRFCPYCQTEQALPTQATEAVGPAPAGQSAFTYSAGNQDRDQEWSHGQPSGSAVLSDILVIRPGAGIWHAEEPERHVPAGHSRPLLIADEQVTHLAHTAKRLFPEELLVRARAALLAQDVTVNLEMKKVCWQRDMGEPRLRLVASLKNHAYSHLKLLFGVDYLGRWASLQLQLAYQPDPLPVGPAPLLRFLGVMCLIGGFFLFFLQLLGSFGGFGTRGLNPFEYQPAQGFGLAFLGIAAGFLFLGQARRAERRAELERAGRQAQRLARTFAVDDMRLFCSAMQEVFQSIVDDIVEQGGEVTRIEGGQGGFFQSQGVTQAAGPERRSDAASLGV